MLANLLGTLFLQLQIVITNWLQGKGFSQLFCVPLEGGQKNKLWAAGDYFQ
jgi:hypothetical protein